MKYLFVILTFLFLNSQQVLARAGATSQDKFLFYIPIGILMIIFAVERYRSIAKTKKESQVKNRIDFKNPSAL